MNKTRVSLFAALALTVVFGVCAQQSQAHPIMWPKGHFQMFSASHYGVLPPGLDAGGLYQGIVAMAPLPPAGTNDWPCFAGDAACSTVAAGGLVIGQPQQVWPAKCDKCGQIFFTFETGQLSGECKVSISVMQGDNILLRTSMTKVGNVLPNQIVTIPMTTSFSGKPGPAVISTTTKVGAMTIHGKTTIYLQ
jgi:hypothetical protein